MLNWETNVGLQSYTISTILTTEGNYYILKLTSSNIVENTVHK